ncbi:MAG: helix-turn-helix domain-containing protein [Planctomycetaceae bacterium]
MERHDGDTRSLRSHDNRPMALTSAEGDGAINLNERQAAKFLGIGARTLWQLRRDGSVPYVRFGRTVRYPKPLLTKWLLERAQAVYAAAADGSEGSAVATDQDSAVGSKTSCSKKLEYGKVAPTHG